MKEPYRKGVANHPDPEFCGGYREVTVEREIYSNWGVSAGGWLDCGGMYYAVGVRSRG